MVAVPDNPISIYRGDDYSNRISFRVRNLDKTYSPVDVSLYGSTWNAQLRKSEDSDEFVAFAVDSSEASTGIVTISLTATQTANLVLKSGVWDLQVTGSKVKTLIKGTFVVDKDVTRT